MSQLTQQELLSIVEKLSIEQRTLLADKLTTTSKLVACITTKDNKYPDFDSLRSYLNGKLPDYFIPQSFVAVEDIPRTSIGKIERKDIQNYPWKEISSSVVASESWTEDDDFFSSSMDYAAPSSEFEKLLAGIWCEVLGIEDISVNDNFIEVGGDSLLSIRILARINKAGLSIAPEDFFEFPTISQQAVCLENTQVNSLEQGAAEGTFNLTPIQQWFFARIKNAPEQWNQNCLLSTDQSLDYVSLERAIQKVMLQHDVLRSVFNKVDGNIKQHIAAFDGNIPLTSINLTGLNEVELSSTIVEQAEQINRSFELDKGPLIQFLYIQTPSGNENKLLITVHHLLIDAHSWQILLEDLSNSWEAMSKGLDFKLSPKSTSFNLWSEKLQQYAHSNELESELDYWFRQSGLQQKNLPLDFDNSIEHNIEETTEIVSVFSELSIDTVTAFCLKNKTDIQTLLISALVNTLAVYADTDTVMLDIEGHGRETLFDKIDVSRTIGWFTTVYPVAFESIGRSFDAEYFQSIKSIVTAIPSNGIGHGVLREIANLDELQNSKLAEVCFNYLGKVDSKTVHSTLLKQESMNIGQPRSPKASRAFVFEINCAVVDNNLTLDWSFSNKMHLVRTVEKLAGDCIEKVSAIVKLNHVETQVSAEDELFELADLDESDLSAISDLLDNIDED